MKMIQEKTTLENLAVDAHASHSLPWCAGKPLALEEFASLRSRMVLQYCKWDPQVGDVQTLAEFPLILREGVWQTLASMAETLAAETLVAENELLLRPELLERLGLPRSLRHSLEAACRVGRTPAAARTIRFDFHWTTEGWRISEANSDVPGGFTEASNFTRMVAAHYPQFAIAGDPLNGWQRAILRAAGEDGSVALLTAPGFMEDHQIMACLAQRLSEQGCKTCLAHPRQLEWRHGHAFMTAARQQEPLDAIVRFYQAEWLAELPTYCGWTNFFSGGKTPVANPGQGIIAESKRFALTWEALESPMPMWSALLPPTRDPREVPWETDESWLLKSAFCNTGDTVSIRSLMNRNQWQAIAREVRRRPDAWVAQKRFEPLALDTPLGPIFPCIGVYTIDGKAAGAYARMAHRPVIDFEAADIALLVDDSQTEECHG